MPGNEIDAAQAASVVGGGLERAGRYGPPRIFEQIGHVRAGLSKFLAFGRARRSGQLSNVAFEPIDVNVHTTTSYKAL